jgi:enoyl-CoA hydratase
MSDATYVLYQSPATHVARIVLNRVESRNAQDTHLLCALNDAFDRAAQDEAIRVIILAANGPHFSSGHDLRETAHLENWQTHRRVGTWCGMSCGGAEPNMTREKELYQGFCERWAAIPKPTIAQVHGKCVSGGLMLVWPCDLVIAADDALFQDNTLELGVGGVEYFAHPWEFGPRKAKELLFTADWLDAREAHRLGMVNHVVPRAELESTTVQLAERIARKSTFALKLAKEAVNGAMNAQGRKVAMDNAFALHQLAHSHNMQVHGMLVDPAFFRAGPIRKPD